MNMNANPLRILLLAGLVLLARAGLAAPSVPPALNYQGVLQPDAGAIAAGLYRMQFGLWSAAAGGTQLWARAFSPIYVASNGVFNVTLTDAGDESLTPPQTSDLVRAFAGGQVYLGLTVVGTPSGPVASPHEIAPAQPFLSVPYSITANLADAAHGMQGPATNLLPRASNWPSGAYGVAYSNVTGQVSAIPLKGIVDVGNDGLSLSSLTASTNVSVTQLRASACLAANFFFPARVLQPAGTPAGTLTLALNSTNTITATKQGLLALYLPAQDGYTVSVSNSFVGAAYTLAGSASGLQTPALAPMIAGSQVTVTLISGAAAGSATYQFLSFGVSP
jgi:hypothetical protein